jgi:hypothetical protein
VKVFGAGIGFLTPPIISANDKNVVRTGINTVPEDNREQEIFYSGVITGGTLVYSIIQVIVIRGVYSFHHFKIYPIHFFAHTELHITSLVQALVYSSFAYNFVRLMCVSQNSHKDVRTTVKN